MIRIALVALQGDVSEHQQALEVAAQEMRLKVEVLPLRRSGVIPSCQGIVLPGGESTTIGMNLQRAGMAEEIVAAVRSGVPVLATCAGLVLVARELDGDGRVQPLGLLDVAVQRNAFGAQRESFEADLQVSGMDRPYRAVFIRAPAVYRVGPGVEVLAAIGKRIVAVREGPVLGLAFHPELTEDLRFQRMFLEMASGIRG